MKELIIIYLSLLICSCDKTQEPAKKLVSTQNPPLELKYNTPELMLGSDFGNFFKTMHVTGRYKDMLSFTSEETIEKFGNKRLLDYYKRVQLSYPLNLRASVDSLDYKILLYKTNISATTKTIQIKVKVENDSAKIVFDSLNKDLPFLGM